MLPRVGAALSRFISPVASQRATSDGVKPRSGSDFQRFDSEQQPKPESPKPELKLVAGGGEAQPIPSEQLPAELKTPLSLSGTPSVASSFLQIIELFRKTNRDVARWLGGRAYQIASRRQRKGARARKGTLIDHQAK